MSNVYHARLGRRFSLLGTSSLVASALVAGFGGLTLTAFTPAVALASCTPTAAGTTAGAAANAKGVQTCGAGDPGVYYNATGNLNVVFTGEGVTSNGVGLGNATKAWNIILGINTTTETAGAISGGIGLTSDGGNVEVDTGSAALGSYAGASVTGIVGISTETAGAGTTKINAFGNVSGFVGISALAGSGTVTINAETNTGAGINVSGGSAGIVVEGGGAVTILAPGNTTGVLNGAFPYGIYVEGESGPTSVTAGNTSGGGNAIVVTGGSGNVTIISNGTANAGTSVAIVATTNKGTINITTGDVGNGILAGGSNGLVTITTNGNVTGANGVTVNNGLLGGAGSGSANVTLNGNVNNNAVGLLKTGVLIDEGNGSGGITLTQAGNTDISSSQGAGVVLKTGSGSITANLAGTVGGAEQVAGDGIDAVSSVLTSKSTISVVTGGVNAAGNGIVATNGGSGFTSVTVNGNVTAGGGVGITATTYSLNAANGTGADTVTLAGNVTVNAGGDGIDMSVAAFGNATLSLGANNTILAGGNGVVVDGFGAGAINISTATKDDQSDLIQTSGGLSDGIVALQGNTATGGISIDFGGNIGTDANNVDGTGIDAQILNAADNSGITIRAGNVSVFQGVGIYAATLGSGDISVTTLKGTDISSFNGDGIDVFGLGGGDVTVTLLDGAVNSHTSGSAVQPFPSGGVTSAGPSGPSAPKVVDPHGVYMIAVADGTATLNQNSAVNNLGPGDAILSTTVDGANTLNINANVSSTLGDGVDAISTGNGAVTVNLFNAVAPAGESAQTQNGVTISTTVGSGILAENTSQTGTTSARIITTAGAPGPLSVTVTNATTGSVGVGAIVHSSNTGSGSAASVDLSNAPLGSSISVEGNGSNVGIEAVALDGAATTYAGAASVTTGANLSVSVGTLGGNNDIGILAYSDDGSDAGRSLTISVGDSNSITVGNLTSAGGVGVYADSAGSFDGVWSGVPVSVALGNLDTVTVSGAGAVGVEAFVYGNGAFENTSTATVTIGNGGSIVVHDTALTTGYGVLASDKSTGTAPVTVTIGSTAVSVDHGSGIVGISSGSNTVSVTSLGNVTSGADGLRAVATGSGTATAGYNNTGNGSATMNFGGNLGVEAIATTGNASASVTLGNGVGQTTIHATNTAVISTGVLASATGTGMASIVSNGNVTVDPTEFAQVATSPLGQASITTGLNDSNSVSDPLGVAPEHAGLAAASGQVAGTASAVITIAGNNSVSVTGLAGDMSGSAGVAAVDDAGGDLVVNTTGAGGHGGTGLSITVGGDDSVGIVASTIGGDGTGGFYGVNNGSAGNVTVNTATGSITVGGTDTTGVDANHNFLNGYGIFTASVGGNIGVDDQASITVSNGAGEGTVGIYANEQGDGTITIGQGNLSTITTNGLSGDTAGIWAYNSAGNLDFGDVNVTVAGAIKTAGGDGFATALTGFASVTVGGQGVAAYTNGNGNVSVVETSTGKITTLGTSDGIDAVNSSDLNGDVSVTVDGVINAGGSGVQAITTTNDGVSVAINSGQIKAGGFGAVAVDDNFGSGTVTISMTGNTSSVSSVNSALVAETNGAGVVSVSNGVKGSGVGGTISSSAGTGIVAINFGSANSGGVTVDNEGAITETGAGDDGIVASVFDGTNNATVTVITGSINSGGTSVLAETAGSGSVKVTTNATTNGVASAITSATGDGIDALASGGLVNVTNNATINAAVNGIEATTFGSDVTVTTNAAITGKAGIGIETETTGSGTININVKGAISDAVGIYSSQTGSGTTNITDKSAADTVTGTTGDGIQVQNFGGTGTVNVGTNPGSRFAAAVSGALDGIDVSGSGTINVYTGANVTGSAGWGISAQSGSDAVTVNVAGGTIQGTTAGALGSGGGILAVSGSSSVIVVSTDTVKGLGANSVGIAAITGGSGSVNVSQTGPLVTGGYDAIYAASSSGSVTVGTAGTPISGQVGDGTTTHAGIDASTGGDSAIVIDNVGNMAGLGNATYGISAVNSGSGAGATINIVNSGNIGSAGSGNGVNGVGIFAAESGSGNGGIVIQNTGNIYADANNAFTVTVGAVSETGSFGILAMDAGHSAISITNSGTIVAPAAGDAAYGGILGESFGNVSVVNSGNIGATGEGITAGSLGGGVVSVSNTAATINVSGGDGIAAVSFGAGSGSVTVTQGNGSITAGGTAIYAVGQDVVTVTSTGTLTGTSGDGIFASGGPGPVTVASTGPSVTGGTDAIYAYDATGPITVGTTGAPITSVLGSAITTDAAIRTQNGVGSTTIVTSASASMAGDTNAAYGIISTSTTGAISVTNGAQIGASGAGNGVNVAGIEATQTAASTNGIDITNNGAIWVDGNVSGGGGVIASGNTSAAIEELNYANITVGSGTNTTYGIRGANLGTGEVEIVNAGVIDPATYGIYGTSGGETYIDTGANVTGTLTGIHGDSGASSGTGVNIFTSGTAVVTGQTGNGIEAFATKGAGINVYTYDGGAVIGGTNGIVTQVTGGAGDTLVETDSDVADFDNEVNVTGNGGDGINATSSSSGYIHVYTDGVTGQGAAGHTSNGIVASSTGGGSVYVETYGSITGDAVGNAGGTGATGITATTTGGNASVYVDAEAADGGEGAVSISAGNYGIKASSVGAGTTTVYAGWDSSATVTVSATGATTVNGNLGPVGLLAIGGTGGGNIGTVDGVSIYSDANIIALNGRGIVTNSGNNAYIDIDAGYVVGLGDATPALGGTSTGGVHPVIDVTAPTGATTTILNDGIVESTNAYDAETEAEFVSGLSDLAIRGTTGSVVVDNDYYLEGRVNFSGLTGNSSVSITNDYEWDTNGTSVLAPTGNDTIVNHGTMTTAVNAVATNIVFGNMTNTFTNTGELDVGVDGGVTGSAAAPAVTKLTGTLTFNNSGLVVLGAPDFGYGSSDRIIDAVLDAPGAAWVGSGASQIDLDANLWSTTQGASDCTSLVLTAADCVIVHSTSGSTAIQVLDTDAHEFGAFNPVGIAIVDGSSAASTFHLASTSDYYDGKAADAWQFGGHTGVLDKPGMFFYDLAYNSAASTEVLIGVPKAEAFEFASFAGAMDGVWYTTTQTWFDRTTDQRDSLQGRADGTQPAVWLKAVGDWTSRTQSSSYSDYNQTYTYNTSYDQSTAGLLGGVDLLHVVQKDQAWTFGIETGWVQSDLRFGGGSPDTLSATATDLGGYVTYLSGGLFVDGVVNANFLRLNDDLPGLGVPPVTSDASGTSWGGQVEAGYSMPLGATGFWEPVGSLSYVDTSFGALPVPGGIDQLGSDTSFRGSLGARVGLTQDFQYYKVKFAVTGRLWDEFENNPTGTLIVPGGPDFVGNDNLKGVFGEFSGQANLFTTTSGLSAFLTGGIKFKSDYEEGSVTIGARYQW